MTIIPARRADHCRECGAKIVPGQRINYGGPGAVTHEQCQAINAAPRRGRSTSPRYGRGRYAYTSTGARMSNRYSRCEDAPCCGCCD